MAGGWPWWRLALCTAHTVLYQYEPRAVLTQPGTGTAGTFSVSLLTRPGTGWHCRHLLCVCRVTRSTVVGSRGRNPQISVCAGHILPSSRRPGPALKCGRQSTTTHTHQPPPPPHPPPTPQPHTMDKEERDGTSPLLGAGAGAGGGNKAGEGEEEQTIRDVSNQVGAGVCMACGAGCGVV